jgi:hypothetical protein
VASSTNAPEEVLVLGLRYRDRLAVAKNEASLEQLISEETMLTLEQTVAATKERTDDACAKASSGCCLSLAFAEAHVLRSSHTRPLVQCKQSPHQLSRMQTRLHASRLAILAQLNVLHLREGDLDAILYSTGAAVNAVAAAIRKEGDIALVRPSDLIKVNKSSNRTAIEKHTTA